MKKSTKRKIWEIIEDFSMFLVLGGFMLLGMAMEDNVQSFIIPGLVGLVIAIVIYMCIRIFRPYKKDYLRNMSFKAISSDIVKIKYNYKKDYMRIVFWINELDCLREILPLLNMSTCTMIDEDIGEIYKILEENVEEKTFEEIEEVRKNPKKSYLIFDGRTPPNVNDELKYLRQGHTRFFMLVNSNMVYLLINAKSYFGIYEKLRQIKISEKDKIK